MTQVLLPGMLADVEYDDELSFFETPRSAIDAIVPILDERMGRAEQWELLDPGCGRGAILRGLLDGPLAHRIVLGTGVELHRDRASEAIELLEDPVFREAPPWQITTEDFFTFEMPPAIGVGPAPKGGRPLLVAGNPPYSSVPGALEFVQRSIELAEPREGIVAMLLQLDFATGVDRSEAVHEQRKSGLYPLKRRPGFGGPHSTGKRPFAWFVWDLLRPFSDWRVIG